MMNRGVMQRQMFAAGGEALKPIPAGMQQAGGEPQMSLQDYLGDQAAPLAAEAQRLGISVEQLLAMLNQQPATTAMPQQPVGMAMGGDPAMAQGLGSMMAAPGMEGMGEQALDPQIVQGALASAAEDVGDLDQAENYETVINSIRGDELPLTARYEELAGVVGEQDAAQTPESVLALVQPAMVMGAVDQGIGGLAAEEMNQPVEGAMAQGIMSTMAPPPQPAAPAPMDPAMMGGPPPVNFNQGGLVRRGDNQPVQMYAPGGEVTPLEKAYGGRKDIYQSILGDPTADLKKQKDLTQSQMLFDIANTALAFAAPMQGERAGMSAAERLAYAARTTQLPQTIGARAQAQLDKEAAVKAQQQQMNLSALTAAEADLTAQAKAAADLKQQELKGSQKLAEMNTQAQLDLGVNSALETLKQAGRINLQDVKGAQSMDLEGLRAANAISLEDYRQVNREAQEGVLQENRVAIETLKATGRTADAILANKLEQDNIVLRGNIDVGKLGVANEYELERMDKSHEQATELNNTNNALKEKLKGLDLDLAERRLSLDNLKAQVAAAQGEEKLRLQAEVNSMTAEMNEFEQGYKTDKLTLEAAAARLTRLGSNTNARITTLISDPERLASYAAGTLSPADTLEMNQAIAYYNAPKSVWSEEKKAYVLQPGNPLSNELLSSIRIRQENNLTYPNIKLEETTTGNKPSEAAVDFTNAVTVGLQDPMSAFGSVAVGKNVINNLFEFFTATSPFKPEKSAINAAKTLNQNFLQTFQKSAELRESVYQAQLLQDLTPTPLEMFTGPEASADKVDKILGMVQNAKTVLQNKIDSLPLDSTEYKDAQTFLLQMNQLENGYGVFKNAYDQSTGGSASKVDTLRSTLGLGAKK